ncbi:MAG: hypothetical protein HOK35_12985 [Cytophagia bacterium]|nr:hypothetical protein [Cytophagia bacterium]
MKLREVLIIFFLFVIYLLFPSANPTTDSWYYAACVKHGQDLFLPHHLLYNALNYGFYEILLFLGIHVGALAFMQAFNAVIAALCLVVFHKILLILKLKERNIGGFILIAGSSFVFIRFATENETYLLALFFSLIATVFFISDAKKSKHKILLSGFFAALACLFHQLHFFWWLAFLLSLFFYQRNFKTIFRFLITATIVPVVYYFVLIWHVKESGVDALVQFVFYEYFQGVSTSFSIGYLKFGIVNFARSFIQIHGQIISLISYNWVFAIPAFFALLFAVIGLSRKQLAVKVNLLIKEHRFLFILIFLLQLLFAFYSYGNAEFMLMLPLLLLLVSTSFIHFNSKSLYWIAASLLIWNLSFSIVPNSKMHLNADEFLITKVIEKDSDLFIIQNSQRLENRVYYEHEYYPNNIIRSPFSFQERGRDLDSLRHIIADGLSCGKNIYTDCLNLLPLDRSFLLSKKVNENFFNAYQIDKSDSFSVVGEEFYLFKVTR